MTKSNFYERDEITIEKDGKKYVGSRHIKGTRKLKQTIYYGKFSKDDYHPYNTWERIQMENVAKSILHELVVESMKLSIT